MQNIKELRVSVNLKKEEPLASREKTGVYQGALRAFNWHQRHVNVTSASPAHDAVILQNEADLGFERRELRVGFHPVVLGMHR
jgi:hypothetical protein